jgi:2-polyprenyl-3-methyl-5-hydroxy-6-metoxy-1,4-benzoquinol methylase
MDTEPDYIAEVWSCWIAYSREYMKRIIHPRGMFTHSLSDALASTQSVLDVGCGIGYTTAAWKDILPHADVYGFDWSGSPQLRIAQQVGADYGVTIIDSLNLVPSPIDLIFASEYFEHIEAPVDHLAQLITMFEPKSFLIANTFTNESVGNFRQYTVGGELLDGATTGRRFNAALRVFGYQQIETKLWNHRPSYWSRA